MPAEEGQQRGLVLDGDGSPRGERTAVERSRRSIYFSFAMGANTEDTTLRNAIDREYYTRGMYLNNYLLVPDFICARCRLVSRIRAQMPKFRQLCFRLYIANTEFGAAQNNACSKIGDGLGELYSML